MIVIGLRIAATVCVVGAAVVVWQAQPVPATAATHEELMAQLRAIGTDRPLPPTSARPAAPWDLMALAGAGGMLASSVLFAAAASGLRRLEEIRDRLPPR